MKKIRLICFGESTTNLDRSIKYKIIGTRRVTHFEEHEQLYYLIKIKGKWYMCGKSLAGKPTIDNPFENPEKYYTYTVDNFVSCELFEVNEDFRRIKGTYWGMLLQSPKTITDKDVIEVVETNFKEIAIDKMWKEIYEEVKS